MSGDALKAGDVVEAAIEKGVYRGRGLARHEGRVIFVPRAHPGDRVRARVSEVHAGWAEAALVEVLEPSPERKPSPCPYVPRCGGCAYQDYDDAAELRLKESVLRESLARAGAAWEGEVTRHASPVSGWRMRASLHFALGADGPLLGLRQEGTRRVIDVLRCLQLSEAMNRAARALHGALAGRPQAERVHGLELLEAPDGSGLVATLETSLARSEAPALMPLRAAAPDLTGFGVRTREGAVEWLFGSPFVEAKVLGLSLRAHAASFFQANRFLYDELASTVVALVPDGGSRVVDLYAGVGLFALPLAARSERETVAVEQSAFACEDALFAARRAGLGHLRVRRADVEAGLQGLEPREGDRVVLDPPRTGASRALVEALAARRPHAIVYVSCDPPTLGRDLSLFAARGYRPDTVHLFDMFPKTFHLETVVRLLPV
ncbi:MAG TPA: TRAM domain-containing protein [Vicinamibacteria bacterium]